MFDLAPHRSYAFLGRTLITLIAVFGLIGSTSLVVIAQDATPAVPETTGSEQANVDTDEPIADTTGDADNAEAPIDQSGGVATDEESAGGVMDTADTSEIFQTSDIETGDTSGGLGAGPPILTNTDWLAAASATDSVTLDPGVDHAYAFTYGVTTHRTGTAIHVELRHADGRPASGWGLSAQAGEGEWAGGDAIVDVSEWGTLVPDTAFTLSLIVTTPAELTAEQGVSLWVSSTASTQRGETETGIVESGPLATLTVVPPVIPTAETSEIVAEVAAEPVVVEEAPFTCDVGEDAIVATGECTEATTSFTDASVTNGTVNGGPSTTVAPGASITADVTVTLGNSANWRATSLKVGNGTARCLNHIDHAGSRNVPSFTETFNDVTAPASIGSYDVVFIAYSDDSCSTTPGKSIGSVTLPNGIVVATPTATDIALSCTPQSVSKAAGEVQTVDCAFSANPSLSARSVALDSMSFAVPAGWILTNPSTGTLDGDTLKFSHAPSISTSQSHTITFEVTPSCTASTTAASLNLTSSFTAYGTSIPGPEHSIDLTRSAGEAVISVGFADTAPFAFGNATVSGLSGDTVAGSAALTIDRAACSEALVSIQISSEQGTNFDPDTSETGTIPLANVSLSSVTTTSGDGYISTSTTGGPITSASNIASVTAGDTTSQYQVNLDLSLYVPAGTPAGTYKATLIVDIVSDGDPG